MNEHDLKQSVLSCGWSSPKTETPLTLMSPSTDWQRGYPFPDTLANNPKSISFPWRRQRPSGHTVMAPSWKSTLGNKVNERWCSWSSVAVVPLAVSTPSIAALAEGCQWLVCRAGLKRHEVGARMFKCGTYLCRVSSVPGRFSTKHIIHFFQLQILPICFLAGDAHIGAGVAG